MDNKKNSVNYIVLKPDLVKQLKLEHFVFKNAKLSFLLYGDSISDFCSL